MYHNEGFCFGFLIDADGGTRTYIDEEIIITRMQVSCAQNNSVTLLISISGGCCTKDSGGNLTLEKNQDSDNALVQSIMASQNSKLAVGLVIGMY